MSSGRSSVHGQFQALGRIAVSGHSQPEEPTPAIEPIKKAIEIPFEHLAKWGNTQEFKRKCAYALARIGTPDSREALKSLSRNEDPDIREYAEEGLRHWPMPFRKRD